jgi:hypothetical protein
MQRDVSRSPSPPNIVGVNVLTATRGQHSDRLGFTDPIGDPDPKQQSTGCYVPLKIFGMGLADRVGGKTAKSTASQSSSDCGSDG